MRACTRVKCASFQVMTKEDLFIMIMVRFVGNVKLNKTRIKIPKQ
jgi:hypothetical protein